MKEKFWLCKRGNIYFTLNSETGKRESLHTRNRESAKRIIQAKNEAIRQPAMNIAIAKAYLVGADPKLMSRTWAFVMDEFCSRGKESTRQRRRRAVEAKTFNLIRNKKLIETTSEDFLTFFKFSGFQRVELHPGEQKTVTFELPYTESAFWYWQEESQKFVCQPGRAKILIGNSSAQLPLFVN